MKSASAAYPVEKDLEGGRTERTSMVSRVLLR